MHPEGHESEKERSVKNASIGVYQYVSKLEKEIKEKEKEIENQKLHFCNVEASMQESNAKIKNLKKNMSRWEMIILNFS